MTQTEQTLLRPVLSSTEAQLFVADIKASCDFYTDKLGFTVAFVYGDPPHFGKSKRLFRLSRGLRGFFPSPACGIAI